MKRICLLIIILFITGCSALSSIIDSAAEASDKILVSAEFTICNAASVGSVVRRYNTAKKSKVWQEIFNQTSTDNPVVNNN